VIAELDEGEDGDCADRPTPNSTPDLCAGRAGSAASMPVSAARLRRIEPGGVLLTVGQQIEHGEAEQGGRPGSRR